MTSNVILVVEHFFQEELKESAVVVLQCRPTHSLFVELTHS